jgi:ribosomal-protein-alanine N-acetyltransferase
VAIHRAPILGSAPTLAGFVELAPAGEDAVEVGLGLRPDCTGRGLGLGFVTAVCDWAARRSRAERLVLRVAAFNARAITV